jgi:hypothetical protein
VVDCEAKGVGSSTVRLHAGEFMAASAANHFFTAKLAKV